MLLKLGFIQEDKAKSLVAVAIPEHLLDEIERHYGANASGSTDLEMTIAGLLTVSIDRRNVLWTSAADHQTIHLSL